MSVVVDMQNTGDQRARAEVVDVIEHVLCDREGEWRVSIIGSRATADWEMKVEGPSGFERSYTLAGAAGEHEPDAICRLVLQLVPGASS